ncbi:hypothetical protein GCM10010172_20880 [Paractinoplanes ferrugineus]|uniref:Uncharacterized protein n=1 Tax=Paractinoplanes ferrugineus TaxID=113564 RepID=A0A919M736_9ACTN|nr:hypothetical protein Afe05nite_08410 [Actinoplanes ferrugineus]
MLLDSATTDDFGEPAVPRSVRVRYELTIELRETHDQLRLFVVEESARALPPNEDRWAAQFPDLAAGWSVRPRSPSSRFDRRRPLRRSVFAG